MRLTELVAELASRFGETEVFGLAGDADVTGVTVDSRRVTPGTVFCALAGDRFDGKDFIESAARRGAAAVISDRRPPLAARLPQLVVPDARAAMRLAAWAIWGEAARQVRLVGITGTNGKTTVAWLVRQMLGAAGLRTGMIGTLGRDVGRGLEPTGYTTPETAEILDALGTMHREDMPWAVLEVSSHSLALGRVEGLDFSVGVFTNLTQDHLDFHGSLASYREAKAVLFEGLSEGATAVLNHMDRASLDYARRTRAEVVWSGLTPECDVWVEVPENTARKRGTDVVLHARGESAGLCWHQAGRHNLENLASAAGAARASGVGLSDIASAAEACPGVPGRLEPVEAGQRFRVLVDYAHTPDGLESVLSSLRPETEGRLICLFGCGGDRDRKKRPRMGEIAERLADAVIVTSDNPRTENPDAIMEEIVAGMATPSRAIVLGDREEAIRKAVAEAREGDVVLVAGKGHETEQIVGGERRPFDDRVVAREALRRLQCCMLPKSRKRRGGNAA